MEWGTHEIGREVAGGLDVMGSTALGALAVSAPTQTFGALPVVVGGDDGRRQWGQPLLLLRRACLLGFASGHGSGCTGAGGAGL